MDSAGSWHSAAHRNRAAARRFSSAIHPTWATEAIPSTSIPSARAVDPRSSRPQRRWSLSRGPRQKPPRGNFAWGGVAERWTSVPEERRRTKDRDVGQFYG